MDILKEASDSHYVRPALGPLGRLCHPCLTRDRLILKEAFYDLKTMREKGVGAVAHEVPLSAIESLQAGPDSAEPSIELRLRPVDGEAETVVLVFRDEAWTAAPAERSSERDEWVCAIVKQRQKLGLAPAPAPMPAVTLPSACAEMPKVLGGKYELLRQIGSGGMGIVYSGRDVTLDRPVAVKKMRPDLRLAGRDKSEFFREAKLSAALHHPFIADIYAVLEEGPDIFLVFEYLDGKTVAEYLEDKRVMPPAQTRAVLKCVCEAIAYAHSCKVIHRDIKPSNIMLTKQGYAKVMDFGIARQLKDTAERKSKTKLDTSGTLAYMAPEQELGRSDRRSDVFSLAATVYEMLSGEQPFIGPNFYLQKEKREFKALSALEPGLPADLVSAVDRCLSFAPEERFQSIDEFAKAAGVK